MDREKLVSTVVEEVVKALARAPAGQPPAGECQGNALTRAGILDHSKGPGTRFDALAALEKSPAGPDRPAAIIGISNRHIHLTPEHVAQLFGAGRSLTPRNELRQPGEYAAKETLTVITHRGRSIEGVRVLGPTRKYTQVELSRTDCFYLGIRPPVRPSGNHEGTSGVILVGPAGAVILDKGVIIADRHLHCPPDWAERWGLRDQQIVPARVGVGGPKPTIFEGVRIRIDPRFVLEAHLDTDDANSACINNDDLLEVIL